MEQFVQSAVLHGSTLIYRTQHECQDTTDSPLSFLTQPGQKQSTFWHRFEECRNTQDPDSKFLNLFGTKLDKDFKDRVCSIISSKSDLLFTGKTAIEELRKGANTDDIPQDLYGDIAPLEVFMGIPDHFKKQQFFKIIQEGDIVIGKVAAVKPFGLFIQLMDLELSRRDIYDCNIQALCRSNDLCQDIDHREYSDSSGGFRIGDYIRGVVVSVNTEDSRINISLKSSQLKAENQNVILGVLEDFDASKLRYDIEEDKTYMDCLTSHPGLNNSSSIDTLTDMLGIDTQSSLLRGLQRTDYPKEDYFDELRKRQSVKWSMSSTAKGVEYFKSGDKNLAMKYLDHALQIDGQNIEALVAKGALSANEGNYSIAIKHFWQALSINHKHKNAMKYLVETLLEQGLQQEKTGQLTEAEKSFQKILDVHSDHVRAMESLTRVKTILKRQKEKEKARQEESSKSKFSHVRKLIEDEEHHRRKKKKKKDKKKKKKRDKKRSRKSKYSESSSSSTESSESDSDDPTPSKRRRSHDYGSHRRRRPSTSSKK